MPLFGTTVSSAPTSRVSLVLALVVSFGTLALKSADIAKVALVLNQSSHSATPRSYFDRTRATFSRSPAEQQGEDHDRQVVAQAGSSRPDSSDELAVNPFIALDELAKSEFPKTTQFAAATAVMMQAEPSTAAADRNTAAAVDPDGFVHLWKIDLQSVYRSLHNHPHELWMYDKQWDGRGYLDCRTQFGDASMVQDFSRFTDYFLWLLRKLRDGDERLRSECSSFGASLWGAIAACPRAKPTASGVRIVRRRVSVGPTWHWRLRPATSTTFSAARSARTGRRRCAVGACHRLVRRHTCCSPPVTRRSIRATQAREPRLECTLASQPQRPHRK